MILDFDTVYALVEAGKPDKAVDHVMKYVFRSITDGDMDKVAVMLRDVDVNRLDGNVTFSLVAVTWHPTRRIPGRDDFVQRAEERLRVLVGDERTERLLVNLR